MWSKIRHLLEEVRSSLWFTPGLIVTGAVVLAAALISVDVRVGQRIVDRWPMLLGGGAAGARSLLQAVAGSMITVAGVVFSITVVALSLASSQYSSRVLRNFMRDRVNQTVLGVFVGIFAYCLVVLRTIRGGDEGAFIPHLSVLFGLVLAFVGMAMLIYYIHHISNSIQASQIVATIANETIKAVDNLYPDRLSKSGQTEDEDDFDVSTEGGRSWHTISALHSGYVQAVDVSALACIATECDAVVRLERTVSEFVVEGMPMVSILTDCKPNDETIADIHASYEVGRLRTLEQDAAFGIRQIVDVAVKALSPGINDTTTAIMCVDHLTAILARISDRRIDRSIRSENGEIRVIGNGPTFTSLVSLAFEQIRQHGAGNVVLLRRLLQSLKTLAEHRVPASRRHALIDQTRHIAEVAHRTVGSPIDRQAIESDAERVLTTLMLLPS